MRKSVRAILTVLTSAALTLSACSSSSDSAGQAEGTTAGSVAESIAPETNADETVAGVDTTAVAATDSTVAASSGPKKLVDGRNLASGNPPHIDPGLNYTLEGAEINNLVWDGLTGFDWSNPDSATLTPLAAEKWEGNADATEFTFTIRKHNFSNGNPVLPSSFAYAWNRASDPKLAATYSYLFFNIAGGKERVEGKAETISGVVADDAAMTLKVTLARPFADFPTMVTHNIFFPLDELTVSKVADQSKYEQGVMIGNGPFVMQSALELDKGLTLAKNSTYWGTPANLDELQFVVSKDLDSAYAAFEAGQLDTSGVPSGKWRTATGKHKFTQSPAHTVDYYVFNAEDPIVGGDKNAKLRQAFSLALDRAAIVEAVCQGSCTVADSVVPKGIAGRTSICDICERDVDRAKKLLEEWQAEGNTLSPIEIAFNSGAGHEDTINLMQAQLAEIGIEVKQNPISSDTYFGDMQKAPAQFFRLGWAADYPLYDNFTYDLFASDSANNFGRLKSKEFDDLVAKARASADANERAASYQAAEKIVVNGGYAVPLSFGAGGYVFSDKVKDAERYPNAFANYRAMTVG
jgi:oligopeptide transport system substrate-binding protein